MMEKQKSNHAVFTSLLKNQFEVMILAAAGVSHLILTYYGFPGWTCPIFKTTGVPCPGCGMSRATIALLDGDWQTMGKTHIFAPVFLLAIVISGLIIVLPERHRKKILQIIEKIDNQSKISLIIILGMVIYWGARLFSDPIGFSLLIKSVN